MTRAPMTPRAWIDVAVHAALALVGIVGLATAFDDAGWLLAGVGGLGVGIGAALAARRLRLGPFPTVGLAVAAYALLGSAVAVPGQALLGFLPTGTSLTSLAVGAVWGWADILTLSAPVDLPDYVTVVPYVSAWLVGLVGTTLAARWLPARPRSTWRAALLLIGPLALYLVSVLLGTREPFAPGVRGVAFAAVALVWLGWRQGRAERIATHATPGAGRGLLRRRLVGTGILVGAAVVIGSLTGAALAAPPDRFVLRERVEPPTEPLEAASPLAGFRQYSKLLEDETILTVTGLEPGQRLRLATMDAYDGHVWTVAGARVASSGSGSFVLVGPQLPPPTLGEFEAPQQLEVTFEAYDDVWIPSVGYATELDLPGASRDELQALRYNAATGSAVLTSGLREGDRARIAALVPRSDVSDERLLDVPVARLELAPVTVIPDVVAAKALEFAGEGGAPIERLRAIELTLQSTGFFSRGTASDSVPSLAGHGADRLSDLFAGDVMVGDEEQYASAFALMARSLGYPARVVLGFAPEVRDGADEVRVRGRDVTAWVEVAFEGVGWVAFSPTPDQTDVPQDQNPKPKTEPQPQVRQPPRASSEQDDLVRAVEVDDGDSDDDGPFALPGWLVVVLVALAVPGVLLGIPVLVLAALKTRRARRRREAPEPHEAVRGAWDEFVDRCAELGLAVPPVATRRRVARELAAQLPGDRMPASVLEAAAARADGAVFGAAPVPDTLVALAWDESDELTRAAAEAVPPRARLLSRYRYSAARVWLAAASARVDAARRRETVR